ncbi:MAG: response regulator [Phycisphaerales bacterium]
MPSGERVLVIEDEELVATALLSRLTAMGYEVEWADRAALGLERLRAWAPACVLLDLRMPEMDGFEVLRRLRLENLPGTPPVIVVSANYQEGARRQALDLGAAAFVGKPYKASDLLREVRRVIDEHAEVPAEG